MSDKKTQSSSVTLDRNEWESLVEDVKRLAQLYERLLRRISDKETNLQEKRGEKSSGQEKGSGGILGFLGLKKEQGTSPSTLSRKAARMCQYCGADFDPRDKFCRICGRKQVTLP